MIWDELEYVVREILQHRPAQHNSRGREYLISWEGYGRARDSWEFYKTLTNCLRKVQQYFQQNQLKPTARDKQIWMGI